MGIKFKSESACLGDVVKTEDNGEELSWVSPSGSSCWIEAYKEEGESNELYFRSSEKYSIAMDRAQVELLIQHLIQWLVTASLEITSNPAVPVSMFALAEATAMGRTVDWDSVRAAAAYCDESVNDGS